MTNSLGNACGELIEVFTELEDSLPEEVYKDLEPVITRVKDAALRSIVVEEQFDLLFRTFKVLSTNPEARLNRRMIELAEDNSIPHDGIHALVEEAQVNPAPARRPAPNLRVPLGAIVPDALRLGGGGVIMDDIRDEDRFDEVFHDPRPREEQDE